MDTATFFMCPTGLSNDELGRLLLHQLRLWYEQDDSNAQAISLMDVACELLPTSYVVEELDTEDLLSEYERRREDRVVRSRTGEQCRLMESAQDDDVLLSMIDTASIAHLLVAQLQQPVFSQAHIEEERMVEAILVLLKHNADAITWRDLFKPEQLLQEARERIQKFAPQMARA